MAEDTKGLEQDDLTVYEVAFLLSPLIPVENIAEEAALVKGVIERAGGFILTQGEPKMQQLAYKIEKRAAGAKQAFTSAYFGWVKYKLPVEEAVGVKKALNENANIVRSMVIKSEEDVQYVRPVRTFASPARRPVKQPADGKAEEPAVPLSDAELDREISSMLVESKA